MRRWPGCVAEPRPRLLSYVRSPELLPLVVQAALRTAKLSDIRFHELRHTGASVWLAAGIQPYKVGRWLGYASLATTDMIYPLLYRTDHTDDVAAVDRFVGRFDDRSGT